MANDDTNIIYLKIPSRFKDTYYKLLHCLADFGKAIIVDCNKNKGNINANIISCWNLFQSAISCEELKRTKEADLFIDYIDKQLNIIYKNDFNDDDDGGDDPVIPSITYYMYIGACPNENMDFDFTINEEFNKFVVANKIDGKYTFYNNTYANYGWICIPNKFNDVSIKDAIGFEVPVNEYVQKEVIIEGNNIIYKCYRIQTPILDGEHTLTITAN